MNRTILSTLRSASITMSLLVVLFGCSGNGQSGNGNDGNFLGNIVNSTLGAAGVDSRTTQAVNAGVALGTKAWELDQLTPENEYYIGRAVAANLIGRYGVWSNPDAARYVSLVGYTCAASSDMPETFAGYRFIILDSDEINAFGAPGGYVLVTRGILKECKDEDALAAVLSHEIGHVQNRDGLNAIKKSEMWKTGLQEGTKLAAQGDIAAATGLFDKLIDGFVEEVINKGYSRDAERKADASGVTIMTAAGYDAHGMLDMLEQMKMNWTPGSAMGKTHPSPDQRLAKITPLVTAPRRSVPPAQQTRFNTALGQLESN
ncbi:MAG TPA: M48 family metalloprotease [Phycisphaerales bacterium]|nr:M48 family metalloprotease [Phycisphaerales bacterium]